MSEILVSQLLEGSVIALGVIGAAWVFRSRQPVSRPFLVVLALALVLGGVWAMSTVHRLQERLDRLHDRQPAFDARQDALYRLTEQTQAEQTKWLRTINEAVETVP